jgi:hypothetical protein
MVSSEQHDTEERVTVPGPAFQYPGRGLGTQTSVPSPKCMKFVLMAPGWNAYFGLVAGER